MEERDGSLHGWLGGPVMIWEAHDVRRWLLAIGACAAVFLVGETRLAAAGSAEDCRTFHQECTEARAAGYRDIGICNVEQLECSVDRDVSVPKRSHEGPDGDRHDPERAVGERSVGP
jgi:hypothetical protein